MRALTHGSRERRFVGMHPLVEMLERAIEGKLPGIIMTDCPMGHLVSACALLIEEGILDGQVIYLTGDDTVQGVTVLGVDEGASEYLEVLEALTLAMN